VPEIVVAGAGLGGLLTALALAGDGHHVTVLERDADAPPSEPLAAWDHWQRRGVAQFRQLFYLLPGFRQLAERELPAVIDALDAVALRHHPLGDVTGESSKRDGDILTLTARRPTVEAAVAHLTDTTPGIDVHRGAPIRGLATGDPIAGVPHVTGVVTDHGVRRADLVVDATGRRSPASDWLAAVGARPWPEVVEDSGFVYHSRHFRGPDGRMPALRGPLLQHFGSLSALTLPAEGGTWGVGLITSSRDDQLRALHRVDAWTAVARALTPIAHWVDGDPITGVDVMTRLEDRHRTLCPDRRPLVTGFAPVADSWASTNPTLGRGTTLALHHALALRDTIRTVGLHDPAAFAVAWHDTTERDLRPHYDAVVTADRHRIGEIDAAIDGHPYDDADVAWRAYRMLEDTAHLDPELLRGWFRIAGLVATGTEVFSEDGFLRRVTRAARRHADAAPVITRDRLVTLAHSAGTNSAAPARGDGTATRTNDSLS